MIKKLFLNFFGIFYILIGIMAFYNSIINIGYSSVLWISYSVMLLIGLGILLRNPYLIGSQINIVLIPYLVWSIDFIHNLFLRKSLWGLTDYVFSSRYVISQTISLQHLFIVPIALISLYFIKSKKTDSWIFSMLQVAIFFFITRKFSEPSSNINCVFKDCLGAINSNYYVLIWFTAYFIMILLVNYFIKKSNIFYQKNNVPSHLLRCGL